MHGLVKTISVKRNSSMEADQKPDEIQFSHFIRRPSPAEALNVDEQYIEERNILAKTIAYAKRTEILSATSGEGPLWENPNIPSGYVYFLQLIAHDMVLTAKPDADDVAGVFYNERTTALNLDTLYGHGPKATSEAYAKDPDTKRPTGRLALGQMKFSKGFKRSDGCPMQPPMRDIAREKGGGDEGLSKALVADDRNDNNAIISQFLTLFTYLHNGIVEHLENHSEVGTDKESEPNFLLARKIVTSVYLDLIENDLLERLLAPHVFDHYKSGGVEFLHSEEKNVPLEFSHAVFRFGHSMIRPGYFMRPSLTILHRQHSVLTFNSASQPYKMPFDEKWIINWSDFFEIDNHLPRNLSGKIEPFYSGRIATTSNNIVGRDGLPAADLEKSTESGTWAASSLLQLVSEMKPELFSKSSFYNGNYLAYQSALEEWLTKNTGSNNPGSDIDPKGKISRNPPLSFYTLFEASHECDGKRLGTLGSIIVADILFAAIKKRRSELVHKDIQKWKSHFFGSDPINSMASFIKNVQPFFGDHECELPLINQIPTT